MNILFKREQTTGKVGRVVFKLWSQLELDEAEQALINRYHFDSAILIDALQPKLLRNSILLGLLAGLVAMLILDQFMPAPLTILLSLGATAGAAYWFYDRNRETIFVRDLLHGRHFACKTVIELAQKEAWLANVVAYLRQVMESAKHWDGTESIPVEALPKEEARQIMLQGA